MTLIDADVMKTHTEYNKGPRQKVGNNGHHNFLSVHWFIFQAWRSYGQPLQISFVFSYPRTTDTQWRHKSKIYVKLGRCGKQNMLWLYLKIWEWEWICGRAVKAISSLGIRSPYSYPLDLVANKVVSSLIVEQVIRQLSVRIVRYLVIR